MTASIAQSTEEKILALIFTDQSHLSKLRNPKTLKSILHKLVHKLGNKSINLNFEKADCLWQRFYNLIEKVLKEDYKDKIEFFDPEIVKILATVFDEAITEFITLAIKPDFKMEFISSKYKNYLRFLIFSSFQLNYRDDVVDRYISQINEDQKIKFLNDIFRILLLPQSEIERLDRFEILNSKKEKREPKIIFQGLSDFNMLIYMKMLVNLEENLPDYFLQNHNPVIWHKRENPDLAFWNYFFEDNKLAYQPGEEFKIEAFEIKYQQDIQELIQTIDNLIYNLVQILQSGEIRDQINLELNYKKKK